MQALFFKVTPTPRNYSSPNSYSLGLGDAFVIEGDFNNDKYEDLFVCGTVWNTQTQAYEGYTAIW